MTFHAAGVRDSETEGARAEIQRSLRTWRRQDGTGTGLSSQTPRNCPKDAVWPAKAEAHWVTWAEIVLLAHPCQPGRGKPSRPRASSGGCKSLQRLRRGKAGEGESGCLLLHLWAWVAGPTLLPLLKCCSFVSSAEGGLQAYDTELRPALPACSRSSTGGSRCSAVSRGSGSSSGGKSLGSSFQSPREPGWRGCGRVKERPRGA